MMEYCIDFSNVASARTFHEILAHTMEFPEWYGHNLDALYDCLTETEGRLVLRNWNDAADFSAGFREVFLDAQEENPDFSVLFQ